MPFRYSCEFRRQVCEQMLAGESVQELAAELSVCNATLYRWRRQALIDAGQAPGVKSYEADRLAQARRRNLLGVLAGPPALKPSRCATSSAAGSRRQGCPPSRLTRWAATQHD
jgi:transposase-like protein